MDYIGIIKERKVIDGQVYRKYFIDSSGKEIGLPVGIRLKKVSKYTYVEVRLDKQKCPGAHRVFFAYADKESQEQAYKKGIVAVANLSKGKSLTIPTIRKVPTRKELHPVFDINRSEIPAGVAVHSFTTEGRHYLKIMVTYFDKDKNRFMPKSMHAGTANTWREVYPKKLAEAIALREESLKVYQKLSKLN